MTGDDTTATVTVEHADGTVTEEPTTDQARAFALLIGTGKTHVDVTGASLDPIDRVKGVLQETPTPTEAPELNR